MALRWYVVHTLSGHEQKVKSFIMQKIDGEKLDTDIKSIEIPVENVTEMHRGKRRTKERKILPGYLLVQMNLTDHIWSMINNLPGVMKVLSEGNKPIPLSDAEVKRMLGEDTPKEKKTKRKFAFAEQDKVRIVNGPFTDFTGTIDELDPDKSRVKVMVTIFGRTTPVELEYYQIEKQ